MEFLKEKWNGVRRRRGLVPSHNQQQVKKKATLLHKRFNFNFMYLFFHHKTLNFIKLFFRCGIRLPVKQVDSFPLHFIPELIAQFPSIPSSKLIPFSEMLSLIPSFHSQINPFNSTQFHSKHFLFFHFIGFIGGLFGLVCSSFAAAPGRQAHNRRRPIKQQTQTTSLPPLKIKIFKLRIVFSFREEMKPFISFIHSFFLGPLPVNSLHFFELPIRKSNSKRNEGVEWAGPLARSLNLLSNPLISFVSFTAFNSTNSINRLDED